MLNWFQNCKLLIFTIFVLQVKHCKQNLYNTFILEYFSYRAPSSIVGFSCNKFESDVELIRDFSDVKLQSLIWKLENIKELFILAKTVHSKLGVFMDLRCQIPENIKSAFTEATNRRMFDELYYWLILGSNLNESLSLINDESFGLSTDFVVAIFEGSECILYDIYNPCKVRGGTLKITQLGVWNESSGLNIYLEINKIRRWNLEGMNLKIAGLVKGQPKNTSVLDYLQDYRFKQLDRATRLACIMWIHLMHLFNFTLNFSGNQTWSNDEVNDSVMSTLIRGDIDISGTAEKMTTERIHLVKAVYLAIPFRTSFIFRSTSSDRLSIRDIFLPLSTTVWYLTLAISILSINILAFLLLFNSQNLYENYLHSIIIHIGAFCQQGTEFSSDNLSGRIALLHILLFNLLLYNYYLASAVSNRLSEPLVFINDSLHELKNKDFQYASEPMIDFDDNMQFRSGLGILDIRACVKNVILLWLSNRNEPGDLDFLECNSNLIMLCTFCGSSSSIYHCIKNRQGHFKLVVSYILMPLSNDWETKSFYIDRWSKIPASQRFMSLEEGMTAVQRGGFAYHTNPEMSYPYVERNFDDRKMCELQEVHLIRPLQLSIFVHINSSFVEMFKAGFLRLSEVGIRHRQLLLWTARKPACRGDVLTADSVTLTEVAPAIIFLFFSMLVSTILLILEYMFSRYWKGIQIKKKPKVEDNSVAEMVNAFNRDSSTENVYERTDTMSENKRDG